VKPATWRFISARPVDAAAGDLGGTEQAVVHLGTALADRGHRIVADGPACGIAVAVNDARLLAAGATRQIVWFHNEVTLWREVKRGRLAALRRHRPVAVFCGAEQARRAWLPFLVGRAVVPHGVPEAVLSAAPAASPPPPHAVFVSQAYRGLADVIGLWRRVVGVNMRQARLTAFIAAGDVARYRALAAGDGSISILPRIPNAGMPALFAGARMLFAPGHASETFCLSAAEAIAMGVPVVTLGVGALKERVADGRTGFVCRDLREMGERALTLLTDDALWLRMQAEGLATRRNAGWGDVAKQWEDLVARTGG
jgi:glycosyltransferase involved in cell wall biosynthesis